MTIKKEALRDFDIPENLYEGDLVGEPDEELISFRDKPKKQKKTRLDDIRERHENLQESHLPQEQSFEETVPDGAVTEAEEMADEIRTSPEQLVEQTGEQGEIEDRKQGVHSDEAFDKELFLPIEELKVLAPTFAEDYGYTGEEGEYILPAGTKKRGELKALLSNIYKRVIEHGKNSQRIKNKEAFEAKTNKELANELKEVDTLNDLEASHVLHYYKKIDTIEKSRARKEQTKRENAEETFEA